MVDTIIGACYNNPAKIYRRLPKQYEDLKMGEKNVNILLMSMTNDLLLAELNKRGMSEFGWDDCDIENLKHGLTCAIERGDADAMLVYSLMLKYRGYSPAVTVKNVFDGLRSANSNQFNQIGDLQAKINDLNDRLAYAESRAEGLEKKNKGLRAEVDCHRKRVDIALQGNVNIEGVGHGLHLMNVEATKPFKQKLVELLVKNLVSWPKDAVAIGPLTTFNGFVGRGHLEDYAVSADLWKEAIENSGRDLLTEDGPLDDSEIGCQICAAKGWSDCHGHSEAEDPEVCKEDEDEANDGPNTVITVEVDTGKSRIIIQGTTKDVKEVTSALGVSYK